MCYLNNAIFHLYQASEHWVTIWNNGFCYSIIMVNEFHDFEEREGPLPCSNPNKSAEFSPLLHNLFLNKHFNIILCARSRFLASSSEAL